MTSPITIVPVLGIPEVTHEDRLATLITQALNEQGQHLQDGDILVVTSKVVSKSEGALVPGDDRQSVIADESVRMVARRGSTVIAETKHGFVMAAAGVDASDIPAGVIAVLPRDPDASARQLREEISGLANVAPIAVIITDTFGRPWRDGLVDQAIGVAGIAPIQDYRGGTDTFGRTLEATVMAIADEIASASELVRGKSLGIPAAIVRGLGHVVSNDDGPGARALLRRPENDWFRYGHRELITSRRTIRQFTDAPVPRQLLQIAVTAALTAPAPHHTHPIRFVILESAAARSELLERMEEQWRIDLQQDGLDESAIARRISRGLVLHQAPVLIAPFVLRDVAHTYPDPRRSRAEEAMFTVAGGAAIENALLALHGEGLASAWISSTLFCPDVVRTTLELPPHWDPLGLIAVGYPAMPLPERAAMEIDAFIQFR